MTNFFSKFFSIKPAPPPAFDLKLAIAECIHDLPPCAPSVVIASPKYSGNYRAEVIVDSKHLADFIEHLNSATSGGNIESQVNRAAFPIWLRKANNSGKNNSYIPLKFVKIIHDHVLNFVTDGTASVFCPDCQTVVKKIVRENRNDKRTSPWSEWTEGWRCPSGHVLYTEDHEIHILRRRAP